MKGNIVAISVLKLCTEPLLISIVDKVSRNCGLYTCCRCDAPLYTLCDTCERSILYATPSCPICERFSTNGELHALCMQNRTYFTHSLACFSYTKTIKCLLHLYKYSGAFQYQRVIESLIKQYFRQDPFRVFVSWQNMLANKRIAIAPVPMTARKRSERGFSPAYEFAVIFGRLFREMYSPNIVILPSLLKKNDDKGIQSHKNRIQRLLSLQRTYSLNESCLTELLEYSPEALVIVDDIVTTGATTNVVIEQVAKSLELKNLLQDKPILRLSFASA